jgi:anaerobic selenocysteine-containing dehydrogenase
MGLSERRAASSPANPPPMMITWGSRAISSILEGHAQAGVAPPESTVTTACPLDCPDACTLDVTVRGGRVTKIDGSTENHITNGYICAKVRRFHERVYGDDRLLYPAVRRGAKGADNSSA